MARNKLPWLLALWALSSAPAARAAEDDPIVLEQDDWVVYDSVDPRRGPGGVPFASAYRQTVFLNFDGERLKQGGNDARTNTTNLITQATLDYPAQDFSAMGGK